MFRAFVDAPSNEHDCELADDARVLCAGEHPTDAAPAPIVFELGAELGVARRVTEAAPRVRASPLAEAVTTARAAAAPATRPVRFGRA